MWYITGCEPDTLQDVFGLQPMPKPLGCGQLVVQKLQRALAAQRSHRLAVAPRKVYFQFLVQFLRI